MGDTWPGLIMPLVGKDHKYSIRSWRGEYRVSTELNKESTKFTLYTEGGADIIKDINSFLFKNGRSLGGVFYINDCGDVVKPISDDDGSVDYIFIGRYQVPKFIFKLSNDVLDNSSHDGLVAGDRYPYPPVGMRYYYDLSKKRVYAKRIVKDVWSKTEIDYELNDPTTVTYLTKLLYQTSNKMNGRFYMNEHNLIFVPIKKENETEYLFVTYFDKSNFSWFPCNYDYYQ